MPACCPRCALPQVSGQLCGACLNDPPAFDQTFCGYLYTRPISDFLRGWKYHQQRYLFPIMVKRLTEQLEGAEFNVIVPVPNHWKRTLRRGRYPSLEIAVALSKKLGVPITKALKRTIDTPSQQGLDRQQRRKNLRKAFQADSTVKDQNILLVDDVMTTGTTANMAALALRRRGARSVSFACLARTPEHSFHGLASNPDAR